MPTGSPSSSPARSTSRRPAARGRSCSRSRRTCSSRSPSPDAKPGAVTAAASIRPRTSTAPRRCSRAPSGRSSIVGGAPWSVEANAPHRLVQRRAALPVASGWRRQDYVDNSSDVYVGHLGARRRSSARAARARRRRPLVIGDRLSEITTAGYTLLDVPDPDAGAHPCHRRPDELGRVYTPTLGDHGIARRVRAGALGVAAARAAACARRRTRQAREDYLDNLRHLPVPGELDMGEVMATVRERLPADAIFTNGAGNFSVWAHRFYEFRELPRPSSRRRAARWATAFRRRLRRSCSIPSGRRRDRGRRRLPDDRPGARDRGAVRRSDRRPRRQQRHARDDPDAPGAPLSRAASRAPTSSTPTSPRWPGVRRPRAVVERTEDFAAVFDEALARGRPP